MVRYLSEADIRSVLTMPMAIERVEQAFVDRANGKAFDIARRRTRQPGGLPGTGKPCGPAESRSCRSCRRRLAGACPPVAFRRYHRVGCR